MAVDEQVQSEVQHLTPMQWPLKAMCRESTRHGIAEAQENGGEQIYGP